MRIFATIICIWLSTNAMASDTLAVSFDKPKYQPGDTLSFYAVYDTWLGTKKIGTLNLELQDIHHTTTWRFRYPVIRGEASGDFILPKDLPPDLYVFQFSLQNDFFAMEGKVVSPYKDSTLIIAMFLAGKEFLMDTIPLNKQKEFKLPKLLFSDRAKVFFKPTKKNRQNDLEIKMQVTLDSTYSALDKQVLAIPIGEVPASSLRDVKSFDPKTFSIEGTTLQNVEVVAKRKTLVDTYEDNYVSGMFKMSDAIVFDGMESDQLLNQFNVFQFLIGKVPGLRIQLSGEGMNYSVQWQGNETYFFLDEMQVDMETIATYPTSDIAMIKVFRPPFYGAYSGGAGGAIGVYTKRGLVSKNNGPRHNFLVNGYTPESLELPLSPKL
ncbi:MAG TPA: hypothetical protein VLC98_11010 [Phnomibacter sp.]|nr:hypothetical protein [Phnomibacter sp.]